MPGQGGRSGGLCVQVRWTTATRPDPSWRANKTSSQSCRRARVFTGKPNSGCPTESSRFNSRSIPATCPESLTGCQGTSQSTLGCPHRQTCSQPTKTVVTATTWAPHGPCPSVVILDPNRTIAVRTNLIDRQSIRVFKECDERWPGMFG